MTKKIKCKIINSVSFRSTDDKNAKKDCGEAVKKSCFAYYSDFLDCRGNESRVVGKRFNFLA